jgi:hypothetical protein
MNFGYNFTYSNKTQQIFGKKENEIAVYNLQCSTISQYKYEN